MLTAAELDEGVTFQGWRVACYVTGDNPADLAFHLMADVLGDARLTIAGDPAD